MLPIKRGSAMRRFAMKALFTLLSLGRSGRTRINWERAVIVISTGVTLGLLAVYLLGKASSRW
jgi:hypothetical protein